MADKTENIKTKLSFDGEAQYKAACKEINSTLKLLNSEMKLVTAEYKSNATSAEALKAKQEVLKKTYEEQKKKVEETEKALAKCKEATGDNSEASKKLETQLNYQKTALANTETELGKTATELEKTEKAADEMGDEVQDSGKQAEDAKSKFSGLKNTLATVGKACAAAVAAIGTAAVAAGKKLYDMATETASTGDTIDKMSQKIGISKQAYQEWDYVFQLCGTDVTKLQGGMKTLSGVITDAANCIAGYGRGSREDKRRNGFAGKVCYRYGSVAEYVERRYQSSKGRVRKVRYGYVGRGGSGKRRIL